MLTSEQASTWHHPNHRSDKTVVVPPEHEATVIAAAQLMGAVGKYDAWFIHQDGSLRWLLSRSVTGELHLNLFILRRWEQRKSGGLYCGVTFSSQ